MAKASVVKRYLWAILLVSSGIFAAVACSGSTSGDSDDAGIGPQFVSDGGAGATLSLTIASGRIPVGATTSFTARLLDPQGLPLTGIRLFCDSEGGVAIIEPSRGGVAFETTDANGQISGVIGGLTPGSFLFQCETPNSFGLQTRTTVVITGTVPIGFAGFPGAAGGNLGGGVIIDETPDGTDDGGISITEVRFIDGAGTDADFQLDVIQDFCETGTGTATETCVGEPFFFKNYSVEITNDTNLRLTTRSIRFTVGTSPTLSTPTFTQNVEVAPGGGTASMSGTFLEGATLAGTTDSLASLLSTVSVTATVVAVNEEGETFTFTGSAVVTFDNVNNCSSGTNRGPSIEAGECGT